MQHRKELRLLGFLVGLTVVLILVVYVAGAILFRSEPATPRHAAPITTAAPGPTPDTFTKMYRTFGPWNIEGNFDTTSDHLALIYQDGTKRVSDKTFHPDSSWQKAVVPAFRDVIPATNGQSIKVRTASMGTFALRLNQPFMLASQPETVYAFVAPATLVSIPTQRLY